MVLSFLDQDWRDHVFFTLRGSNNGDWSSLDKNLWRLILNHCDNASWLALVQCNSYLYHIGMTQRDARWEAKGPSLKVSFVPDLGVLRVRLIVHPSKRSVYSGAQSTLCFFMPNVSLDAIKKSHMAQVYPHYQLQFQPSDALSFDFAVENLQWSQYLGGSCAWKKNLGNQYHYEAATNLGQFNVLEPMENLVFEQVTPLPSFGQTRKVKVSRKDPSIAFPRLLWWFALEEGKVAPIFSGNFNAPKMVDYNLVLEFDQLKHHPSDLKIHFSK